MVESEITLEGALALLAAIARRWLLDCRHDPTQIPELAAWLNVPEREVHRQVQAGGLRPRRSRQHTS